MKIYRSPDSATRAALLRRPEFPADRVVETVAGIVADVRRRGDAALLGYTERFDGVRLKTLRVSPAEMEAAEGQLPPELRTAIRTAADNIRRFHAAQRTADLEIETMPGVVCQRKSVPLDSVGLYAPGGTAPLFSSVLMLGIPARLAGCGRVFLCSPPGPDGSLSPTILFAARVAGIDEVYKLGGAQAIAAMAFGTETLPRAAKICGPGNRYVTAAKERVRDLGTAIDMSAGPSEVLVVADRFADPGFVAADLLSQAEHGPDSQVVLVTDDAELPERVLEQVEVLLPKLPRAEVARAALKSSFVLICENLEEALDFSNDYAPEHLILALREADRWAEAVRNAGSVFLGNFTPESAGDYASGTNHTLPTGGTARAASGVSLDTFLKKITFQRISAAGLERLGPTVETMATAEGLTAHRLAVSLRLEAIKTTADV